MNVMNKGIGVLACLSLLPALAPGEEGKADKNETSASVYQFTMNDIDGKPVNLADYKGQVLLIINVASKCGLTDTNYTGLTPLYDKYREKGLRILAFPANNFGAQEPGSNEEIKAFCTGKYDAKYDLFAKVSVKGDDICPLYKYLIEHPDDTIKGEVKWNFQKYLVGRDGRVLAKFDPRTKPDDAKLIGAMEAALKENNRP